MRNRNGFSTLELIIASGVTILSSLIVGLSLTFFTRQASQQAVQIEQTAQAQAFLQLLRRDLASASDILPDTTVSNGFKLTQKVLAAGSVAPRNITYTIGGTTTCTTSTKKSFSCVRVQRKVGSQSVELPNVVAFRWCSEKLRTATPPVLADCSALASLNQPAPALPARFMGRIEFLAYPDRPAGMQNKSVSFIYEAANLGAKIQVLKTE
jgi:type II secretory pathway pseudopilin PulG